MDMQPHILKTFFAGQRWGRMKTLTDIYAIRLVKLTDLGHKILTDGNISNSVAKQKVY